MEKILNKLIFSLKILSIILILLVIAVFIYSYIYQISNLSKTEIDISDNWEFSFYENIINYPDSNLSPSLSKTISLPYDISGEINYKKGVVILSKEINLSELNNSGNSVSRLIGLRLGKLSDGVEVYLDNLLVYEYGKKGDIIFSAFNFDKTIPLITLNNEKEFYQLKIAIYILTNVSITSPFYLGDYYQLYLKSEINNFFNVKIKRFLILVIILILIIFFYLGFKEKRNDLIYFSLSSFFVLLFSLNQIFEYLPINYLTFNYLFIYKSMYLMTIFFILSLFYILKKKINTLVKIIVSFFIIVFIIDLVLVNNYNIRRQIYTYVLFIGILVFFYMIFTVYKEYFYKKNKELKSFVLPFTILLITISNDILVFIFPGKYPQIYLMIYGFEIYTIMISQIIMNQLINTYIATDIKNKELEESNKKLQIYLNDINFSIDKIKQNKALFATTSTQIIESTAKTRNEIERIKIEISELNKVNLEINEIDKKTIDLSSQQIESGNRLKQMILMNYQNFEYMKNSLQITKDFSNQIEGISKKTNLLGLNASIESTKSPEYSKSFLVVAQEVKNLALKSTDLANQIKIITDEIIRISDSGIESSQDLNNYFEDFYNNFQNFMATLGENQNIHMNIKNSFNDLVQLISYLTDCIYNLNNLADEIGKQE